MEELQLGGKKSNILYNFLYHFVLLGLRVLLPDASGAFSFFICVFNLLVYWQLRCVLLLLCFQFHAFFLLIDLPECVCVCEQGEVMSGAATLCTHETPVNVVELGRSWMLWKSLRSSSKRKAEVQRERRGARGGLWVSDGGLYSWKKWFVCYTAFSPPDLFLSSCNKCKKKSYWVIGCY